MSLLNLSLSASSPIKAKVSDLLNKVNVSGRFPDLSTYTVNEAIVFLKDFRFKLKDNDPFLSVVDSILVPLMELEYHNPASAGPYDVHQNLSKFLVKNVYCQI